MLGIEGSKYLATLWAGDTPLEDYRISPMNGDIEGLGHITIVIGTKETLYPDALKLSHMLNEKALHMTLYKAIICFMFILFFRYQNASVS